MLEGGFQSHHHMSLVRACWGPEEVGIRRLLALLLDLPPASRAGRALGMWSEEDEQAALAVELVADTAATSRAIASLLMPSGKTYDVDPALRWDVPNRPDLQEPVEPEMTRESIDAAIAAAVGRG